MKIQASSSNVSNQQSKISCRISPGILEKRGIEIEVVGEDWCFLLFPPVFPSLSISQIGISTAVTEMFDAAQYKVIYDVMR